MEKLIFLRRCIHNKNTFLNISPKFIQNIRFSSNSDNDNNKQNENETKKESEEALKKLNNLLKTMITAEVSRSQSKLDLAKPKSRRKKDLQEKKDTTSKDSAETQIVNAIKGVAESVGGDVRQTESELLMKLLNLSKDDKTTTNLSDIVKGMKIEDTQSQQFSRADEVRQILQQRKPIIQSAWRTQKRHSITEKIDLFGSEPLGIFSNSQAAVSEEVQNEVWNNLYERDLKLAVTHPPNNYFQQMILWTEQGKVWKFPIDNEQGLEEESKIYFTDHVFLDKHLEGWCPSKGPLRHFMELVCVGLSKNPYLTVETKKENIEWFRNYFEDKKQLLKDVGLSLEQDLTNSNVQKQIE